MSGNNVDGKVITARQLAEAKAAPSPAQDAQIKELLKRLNKSEKDKERTDSRYEKEKARYTQQLQKNEQLLADTEELKKKVIKLESADQRAAFTMEKELAVERFQVQELTKEKEELVQKISEVEAKVAGAGKDDERVVKLVAENKKFQEEEEKHAAGLAEANKRAAALAAEIEMLRETVRDHEKEQMRSKAANAKLEAERDQQQKEYDALQDQFTKFEKDEKAKSASLRRMGSINEKSKMQMNVLEGEVEELKKTMLAKDEETKSQRQLYEDSKQKVMELTFEVQSLKDDKMKLSNDKSKLVVVEGLAEDLKAKNKVVQKKFTALQEEHASLWKENKDMLRKLGDAKTERDEALKTLADTKKELVVKTMNAANATKALGEAETSLEQSRTATDAATEQLKIAGKENVKLSDQLEEMLSEIDRVKKDHEIAEDELQRALKSEEKLTVERDELNIELESFQQALEQKEAAVEKADANLAATKKELVIAKTQAAAYTSQLKSLSAMAAGGKHTLGAGSRMGGGGDDWRPKKRAIQASQTQKKLEMEAKAAVKALDDVVAQRDDAIEQLREVQEKLEQFEGDKRASTSSNRNSTLIPGKFFPNRMRSNQQEVKEALQGEVKNVTSTGYTSYLKVPKDPKKLKKGWNNRWCKIERTTEGNKLFIFANEETSEPIARYALTKGLVYPIPGDPSELIHVTRGKDCVFSLAFTGSAGIGEAQQNKDADIKYGASKAYFQAKNKKEKEFWLSEIKRAIEASSDTRA